MADCVFRVGGEGGEGVISTGELLTLALARSGFEIYTFRTYPAEIKGGHANYQVRASDQLLLSQGAHPDVFVAFNEEAYQRHVDDLLPNKTILMYDSDSFTPPASPKFFTYPIPMTSLATEKVGVKLTKNIICLGALSSLFDIPAVKFEELLKERFGRKGEAVVQKNLLAFSVGREYMATQPKKEGIHLGVGTRKTRELVLSGNESLALGAMAAGLKVYAGYPITPASDIMEFLAKELPKIGGFMVQTEDEISAIGTVLGASFAGVKAMTATSGPGFSLMIEMLGLAVMSEMPAVIVNVQRVGPSTGMPTKTEQADLYAACYGGHGSCPRIVMALTSVEDAFYGIMRAFNLAEQFQMPVIVLSDQSLGHRKATVPAPDPSKIPIINRKTPTPAELVNGFKRYKITEDGISPMPAPGMAGGYYTAEGLEHDEIGYPAASNHENHFAMTQKRYKKFQSVTPIANELVRQYGVEKPEIGIIGWGSSEGVIREAVQMAVDKGYSVGALHPKILYPTPLDRFRELITGARATIIPELNLTGQFCTLLRKRFAVDFVQYNRVTGLPFTPKEIFDKIEEVANDVARRQSRAHATKL